jgi:hypothetical protein
VEDVEIAREKLEEEGGEEDENNDEQYLHCWPV